ncbi:hypothetical protein [Marinobacterium litorale]|jgi:hypothetical protein|uniref:hypothetical protein n=1 Tax=Marinobacterium litorale TaxID=404770 RepID=UPI000401B249|nr:hypothetical protein [Marinobacterium litorale]
MHLPKTLRISQIQVIQEGSTHIIYAVDQLGRVWVKRIEDGTEQEWQSLDMYYQTEPAELPHAVTETT